MWPESAWPLARSPAYKSDLDVRASEDKMVKKANTLALVFLIREWGSRGTHWEDPKNILKEALCLRH